MAKYLVTGGAGFIGSHIATALVERSDAVRVLDNLNSGKRENLTHVAGDVELIEGDVLDAPTVECAVRGVEVVYHQAALASVPASVDRPLDSHAHCVTATVQLLDACRRAKVRRVVFASSAAVYGDRPTASKQETDLPAPRSPYAAAKIASEYYCQAFTATYGLETVALRYFNVFGPRQDPGSDYAAVIPKFVTTMLAGKRPTVFGDGMQSRDFVYVEDVVRANLAAANSPSAVGRSLNVACGRQTNLLELIAALNRALGTEMAPVFNDPRPGDVRESLADITAAQSVLGYTPQVDFDVGLRRSIDYYKSLGSRVEG